MPYFDGTGPIGQGAMSGKNRGHCTRALNDSSATLNGRNFCRKGKGRRRRNCFNATGIPGWIRTQKGMQAFSNTGSSGTVKADNTKNA